jgi:tRNA dimethylallyltransferase
MMPDPGSTADRLLNRQNDVVVIAGPTASGKSGLALQLADQIDGEIINADSMQIYDDLQILSARPSSDEMGNIPHHLYGIRSIDRPCDAHEWREIALDQVADCHKRDKIPILVGGTGLYLSALIDGLSPIPDIPQRVRDQGNQLYRDIGGPEFVERLAELDPVAADKFHPNDRQRLVRAWEVVTHTGTRLTDWQDAPRIGPPDHLFFNVIALMPDREWLYPRINQRFDQMVEMGGMAEVQRLAKQGYDPDLPGMKALGVPSFLAVLEGEMKMDQAIRQAKTQTRQYAKRQYSWFKHRLINPRRKNGSVTVITATDPNQRIKVVSKTLGQD